MVRERTTFRNFNDRYILPSDKEQAGDGIRAFAAPGVPLEVDLGCGRGRFLIARARCFPHHSFVGIERVLLRLRKVDSRAQKEGLSNIRLIRSDVMTALREILPPGSVSTFYLYFPDPWPKRRHHTRRLVSPDFIEAVHAALVPGGSIHLCTDHADYYASMERIWRTDSRFAHAPPHMPDENGETDFGLIFRRKALPVYRCSFRKAGEPAGSRHAPLAM